jgi:hypothetical protein
MYKNSNVLKIICILLLDHIQIQYHFKYNFQMLENHILNIKVMDFHINMKMDILLILKIILLLYLYINSLH